jgi:SAM-dependent methyltransferase
MSVRDHLNDLYVADVIRQRLSVPALMTALRSPGKLRKFLQERSAYLRSEGAETHWGQRFMPMLEDDVGAQNAHDYYFYQDTWGARKIFELRPQSVVDVGSTVLLVGIVSQFVPTTSVDVRPVQCALPGLTAVKGNITELAFPDASQDCVMSLCVIEHIGLGRYGDPLDANGARKAARELSRVIKPGGHLLISTMVGPPCLAFNAHRIFSVEEFLAMFPDMEPIEEVFLYPEPGPRERLAEITPGQGIFYCVQLRKK